MPEPILNIEAILASRHCAPVACYPYWLRSVWEGMEADAQAAVTRARREALEEAQALWLDRLYEKRCVFCKHARVEIVEGDKDPREADTYCGNDESPCHDRTVSFFGDDTCAHFAKGEPVHETRAARLAGEEKP